MSYWYVATPYAKYPQGKHRAFKIACEQAAILAKAGVAVFSPIAHSHSVATFGGIDAIDHEFWMKFDRPMMDAAKGLVVVKMATWEVSRGIAYEIDTFRDAGKPVVYMEPNTVPQSFTEGN